MENATRGWDMAFYGLSFAPGDRILTSVSEYASNYIAFLQVAQRCGAVVEAVPDDASGQLCVASMERMLDERVKLIAVTHVPTNGGLVNPAAEIGAVARRHGIPFLLDACQSVGQIPLDVDALQVDFLSATSRKFLRGPRGMGFLYVRRDWISRVEPPFLDLHAATWTGAKEYVLRDDAKRFENWECNVAAKLGLGTAVDYALALGMGAIHARVATLAETLRDALGEVAGVTVRDQGEERCGIVTFSRAGHDPESMVKTLSGRGINTSVITANSTLLDMDGRNLIALVRAGIHYYNSEEEIERFIDVLSSI